MNPRLVTAGILALLGIALLAYDPSTATADRTHANHKTSGMAYRERIIRRTFGTYGSQAVRVARCESGIRPWAANGQYRGVFQMGSRERAKYGHGRGTTGQARAALRYFRASGRDWSPWGCKP